MRKELLSIHAVTAAFAGQAVFKNLTITIKKGQQWAVCDDDEILKSRFLDVIEGKCSITSGGVKHHYFDEYLQQHSPDDPLFNHYRLISRVSARHTFKTLANTTDFYYQQRYHAHDSEDVLTVISYLNRIANHSAPVHTIWTLPEIIKKLHLENLLDKQLIKLSNGESRRLLIAAALLKQPVLLLLENPFTGLDTAMRKELNTILTEIAASGISMIITTTLSELPEAVTTVLHLGEGFKTTLYTKDEAKRLGKSAGQSDQDNSVKGKPLLPVMTLQSYNIIARLDEVSVRYGQTQVLDRVSWEIKQGERWELAGPNGAGKSTLLSLITADHPQAYSNTIVLFDEKRNTAQSIWEIKRKIGFVSPELFQYFDTSGTCLQVVISGFFDSIGLYRRCSAEQHATALHWLELFDSAPQRNMPFGMAPANTRRLCLLARALVKNPALLVLDEPCQGLNRQQTERFKYLIDTICKETRMTLIYVTHKAEEKPSAITHVLKLDNGRVVFSGPA